MSDTRTPDQIAEEIILQLIAEKRDGLDGPECAPGTHTVKPRQLLRRDHERGATGLGCDGCMFDRDGSCDIATGRAANFADEAPAVVEWIAHQTADPHGRVPKPDAPACPSGTRNIDDPTYGSCTTCKRSLMRDNESSPWRVNHASGCECRECRTRWMEREGGPWTPKLDLRTVDVDSLVVCPPETGRPWAGHWRITGFYRVYRRGDDELPTRWHGRSIVECPRDEAEFVSLYAVCGDIVTLDDFLAHAILKPRPTPETTP